tara:strand:+ start:1642 stop:1830 length:189 start_codon:yes stop_codon:yes gene_type:complete
VKSNFVPGDWVISPQSPEWGVGQVQSIDQHRVTVNFEHSGKRVINLYVVNLEPSNPPYDPVC